MAVIFDTLLLVLWIKVFNSFTYICNNYVSVSRLSVSEMSIYISEIEWKTALIHILVELDEQEYKKMLMCRCFHDIPKSTKNMPKDEMPQLIIQHFGVHKSISAINEAMIFIPRNDPKVQDLLRPFVDNLMKIREEKNEGEFTQLLVNDCAQMVVLWSLQCL